MSYRHTIQAGLESLREIEQLLDEFPEKDSIPAVELDLILQKTRNFYEIMLMLRQHQRELSNNMNQRESSQEQHQKETSQEQDQRESSQEQHQKETSQEQDQRERSPEQHQHESANGQTAKQEQFPSGETSGQLEQERLQEQSRPLDNDRPFIAAASSDEASAGPTLSPGEVEPKPGPPSGEQTPKSGSPGGDIPSGSRTSQGEKPLSPQKEATILSEKYSGRSSLYDSIHDAVAQKNGGPLGQVKPVKSIRSAIGINDRFTYIRELFNNDNSAYDSTIGILDEAANFNEAYNYMIQHFDWDMDSEEVQHLLDIIRRKYITGRHE